MNLVPFVVLLGSPEANTIVGRIEASFKKMKDASIFVSDGLSNTIPTKVRLSPGVCLVAMPNQQIAEVKPTEVRFYDQIFNQVTSLKNAKPAKVPDSAARVAIVHREPIAWLVDEIQRKEFFDEVRRDSRWKVIGSSLVLVDAKRNAHSEIYFDTSYRVTDVKLTIGQRGLSHWKYRFVKSTDIPQIPANAKVVKGLPPRPTIPSKTDGKSVLFAQKIWRSVSRLEGRKITQVLDDGSYNLTYGSGKLTESGPKGSWSVTNNKIVISPKSGGSRTFSGNTDKFLDSLRAQGIDASPIGRYILNRKVPFLDMFDRTSEVKLVEGLIKTDGHQLMLMTLKRSGIRIRMYVDPKTNDLVMVSSDSEDPKGNLVSGSRIKISYQ